TITNEVKRYLQGWYGQAPAPVNEELRRAAIGKEEVIEVRPADLLPREMDNLRQQIGALAESEEDVLTFAMFPDVAKPFLEQRKAGTLKPEPLVAKLDAAAVPGIATEFKVTVHGETFDIHITGIS